MIEVILQEAAQHNVSDIHINDTVYFRINKEIYTYQSFQAMQKSLSSVSNTGQILPSYKNLQDIANSSQNISQDDFPYQDSISLDIDAIKYELRSLFMARATNGLDITNALDETSITTKIGTIKCRISAFRVNRQHCFALRILKTQIPTFHTLQTPQVLEKLSMQPHGLILVCGATGAGKSSTLAAMLHHINTHCNKHILTIEDPIEYVYQSSKSLIHQREIGLDVKDYMTAITSALREDPDVIVVGEMRDYQTIQAVMTLAETGHLVFSTLHTIGAVKTMDRIIDSFPKNSQEQIRVQLSSVLKGVVSQQLLPLKQGGRKAAFECGDRKPDFCLHRPAD